MRCRRSVGGATEQSILTGYVADATKLRGILFYVRHSKIEHDAPEALDAADLLEKAFSRAEDLYKTRQDNLTGAEFVQ